MSSTTDFEITTPVKVDYQDFTQRIQDQFRAWNEGFHNISGAKLLFQFNRETSVGNLSIMKGNNKIITDEIIGEESEKVMLVFISDCVQEKVLPFKTNAISMTLLEVAFKTNITDIEPLERDLKPVITEEADKGMEIVLKEHMTIDEAEQFFYTWRYKMVKVGIEAYNNFRAKKIFQSTSEAVEEISKVVLKSILSGDILDILTKEDINAIIDRLSDTVDKMEVCLEERSDFETFNKHIESFTDEIFKIGAEEKDRVERRSKEFLESNPKEAIRLLNTLGITPESLDEECTCSGCNPSTKLPCGTEPPSNKEDDKKTVISDLGSE